MTGFATPFAPVIPVVAQLLLGGPPPAPSPEIRRDPSLPTGAALGVEQRPVTAESPACSFRVPVCVHRAGDVSGDSTLLALSHLESAYERLVYALGLPPPRSSREGARVDLYLDPEAGPQLATAYDPVLPLGFDSAALFCRIAPGPSSALERAATRCVAEAIAARLDAATSPHVRRAYATQLWWATGSLTTTDLAIIDDAQSRPDWALLGRNLDGANEAQGALFFEYLDAHRGRGRTGWVPTAILAAAANTTRGETLTWNNEPDVFDVLRHTLDEKTGEIARLFGDFAVARAFLGTRDDQTHWARLRGPGEAGAVVFDWHLPLSTFPRLVAATRPIEPFGATYIWVELDEVELGTTIGFQAQWEAPVAFQWTLVRVAKDGRELSRLVVPFKEQGTEVTQTITNLEASAGILIVGTQMGGVDLLHPFDPDVAPFEPHSCTVYLVKVAP